MSRGPDSSDETRCPRCGGAPAASRKPTIKNPFMSKSKKLCCSLCGLDYDRGARPWAPDASTETGRPDDPKEPT